jgi:mannosyl-glycoprotein endo-beta-N-acetylglucosaminidase
MLKQQMLFNSCCCEYIIASCPWLTALQVLGTFITEFGQGRQRCNRLFASRASAQAVADQLVAVACHYGFEGWLVNIENSLSSDQVQVMLHFVGYLRARMKAACSHGVVVW